MDGGRAEEMEVAAKVIVWIVITFAILSLLCLAVVTVAVLRS